MRTPKVGRRPRDIDRSVALRAAATRRAKLASMASEKEKAARELLKDAGLNADQLQVAISLALAIDQSQWLARPVGDSDWGKDEVLLLRLLSGLINLRFKLNQFGGTVRPVTRRELNSVRFQSKRLLETLRDLPPDVRFFMAESTTLDLTERLPGELQALEAEATRWLKGRRAHLGVQARELKSFFENTAAFDLAHCGVELTASRVGVLANVLRAGYEALGIKAGGDPVHTCERLRKKWTREAVKAKAEGNAFVRSMLSLPPTVNVPV